MARDEHDNPVIPHVTATGADCGGCLVVEVREDQAAITCNECGSALVRTVPANQAAAAHAGQDVQYIADRRLTEEVVNVRP